MLQLRRYGYYLLFSHDEYHIHSPFVFDFYLNVIQKPSSHPLFNQIESLRTKFLNNSDKLEVQDFGSGAQPGNNDIRKIKKIARNSLKPRKQGELLYRIIKHFNPSTAIELGTSLGIPTLYQSIALKDTATLHTLEGASALLAKAKENFKLLQRKIVGIEGNIDQTLPGLLKKLNVVDYVFFDANHRFEPTLRYFELCLEKATEDSVFIFDDIHRDVAMDRAWSFIKSHKQVTLTLDLFHLGIVLFRRNQPKQHFMLKF